MQKILVKVKDKSVLMNLRQFGDIQSVSVVMNIYSLEVKPEVIPQIKTIPGVLKVENEEYFDIQNFEYVIN